MTQKFLATRHEGSYLKAGAEGGRGTEGAVGWSPRA